MSNDITAAGSLIRIISRSRQNAFPGIKGFNRRGLYRMRKFYETYKDDEFVTTLLSQISWSNHLAILSKAKTEEERHFYISLCVKESEESEDSRHPGPFPCHPVPCEAVLTSPAP